MLTLLRVVFSKFAADNCPRMAAALAYYTMFSLAPLLVVCMWIGSWFFESTQVAGQLSVELGRFLGAQAADQVQQMIEHARAPGERAMIGRVASLGVLAFGASGLMLELQSALNQIWRVKPQPKKRSTFKRLILKRVLSFTMVIGIALLLIGSLLLNTWLKMFFEVAQSYLASEAMQILVLVANSALAFAMTLALILLIFKYLPDAQIAWRHVLLGALLTTALLTIGRWGVGLYLGARNFASLYGAAGSLVMVLAWVYYSTILLLLGGEFTFVWAHRTGEQVPPEPGAVRTKAAGTRAEKRFVDGAPRAG